MTARVPAGPEAEDRPIDHGSLGAADALDTRDKLDLRLLPAALATWAGAAIGVGVSPGRTLVGAAALCLAGAMLRRWRSAVRRGDVVRGVAGAAVMGLGGLVVASLHGGAAHAGPIPHLAEQRAHVTVELVLASDPLRREGRFAPYVVLRARAVQVTGRGLTSRVRTPLLIIADESWLERRLGDRVRGSGRLTVASGPEFAAVLAARGDPTVVQHASWVYRGIGRMRQAIVDAVQPLGPAERALVPALVDGDDSRIPKHVVEDFQTTGLTHLLAVSGANLTLVLAFVMFVGRWCGVRARGLPLLGGLAVVGFVLLARPEPSVVRAAAMGVVALVGTSAGSRGRGVRALCLAVLVLVLVDPWLARSVGFLLSVLATGGILLLSPRWSAALGRWLPRPVAEAVAVPLAAQLVCTPVVAAISGQVSLVAVLANLLAAPAVGPATVLGLVGGLVALVSVPIAQLVGRLAGLAASWIVWVAGEGASFVGASMRWPVGGWSIVVLGLLCAGVIGILPAVLSRRPTVLAVSGLMVLVIINPVPRLGWPPPGWIMVACDVGQGDGLVLNAGQGVAVVVDAGPDPMLMDACLDRLRVRRVALVVLTHFHADHVDGLPGVLSDRQVAEVEVSPLADPPDRAAEVRRLAARAGVPVSVAAYGERRAVGDLAWTVIGPVGSRTAAVAAAEGAHSGEEGSAPNNASVVMLVEARGYRLLLSGDAEPEEESAIMATGVDLTVDVFKVSHHGSANQDPDFVFATRAPLAVVSAGADNDYGHPSGHTLGLLRQLGAHVYRTDQDGDIAVVVTPAGLSVATDRRG